MVVFHVREAGISKTKYYLDFGRRYLQMILRILWTTLYMRPSMELLKASAICCHQQFTNHKKILSPVHHSH